MRTKQDINKFSEKCQECFKKWEVENITDNEFIIDPIITQCLDKEDDSEIIEQDSTALIQRMGDAMLDPYFSRQKPIKPSGRDYGLLFE